MPQASVADTVTEGSLDVHLESVARAHPAIERTGRNPFRFGQSSQGVRRSRISRRTEYRSDRSWSSATAREPP